MTICRLVREIKVYGPCALEEDPSVQVDEDLCHIRSANPKKNGPCSTCGSSFKAQVMYPLLKDVPDTVEPTSVGRELRIRAAMMKESLSRGTGHDDEDEEETLPPQELTPALAPKEEVSAQYPQSSLPRVARTEQVKKVGVYARGGEPDMKLVSRKVPLVIKFSAAHRRAFLLFGEGKRDADVAASLGISAHSLTTYKSAIYKNLEISHLRENVKYRTMLAIARLYLETSVSR